MSLRVSMSAPENVCLLGRHVFQRADHGAEQRGERFIREPAGRRFGHAKVNHLRNRLAVDDRHQDIGWLEVAVNNALLVRMLDGLADLAVKSWSRSRDIPRLASSQNLFKGRPLISSMTK